MNAKQIREKLRNYYLELMKIKNGVVEKLPLSVKIGIYYRRAISYAKKYDPNAKQYIKDNVKWKDRYKGKRCFVLGNGPSLKSLDLSKLENEYVFVCNSFSNIEGWKKAKPNFYFSGDLGSWQEDDEIDEYLISYIYPYVGQDMDFFFNLSGIRLLKKYKLDQSIRANYYIGVDKIYNYSKYECPIEYTKASPGFCSTIPIAISWALYMGFDQIYLHGIDSDFIYTYFAARKDKNKDSMWRYAYGADKIPKEPIKITHCIPGGQMGGAFDPPGYEEWVCYNESMRFKLYRILDSYAKKQGTRIYNCSSHSFVTIFPFVDVNEVYPKL